MNNLKKISLLVQSREEKQKKTEMVDSFRYDLHFN